MRDNHRTKGSNLLSAMADKRSFICLNHFIFIL